MDTKLSADYFAHLNLSDNLGKQEVQAVLIKYWFMGYQHSTVGIKKPEVKATQPIDFSNCFIYQMPITVYQLMIKLIFRAGLQFLSKEAFNHISSYIQSSQLKQISFDMFGVHIISLFGDRLQFMNEFFLIKCLRKLYIAISQTSQTGAKIQMREFRDVKEISLDEDKDLKNQFYLQNQNLLEIKNQSQSFSVENPSNILPKYQTEKKGGSSKSPSKLGNTAGTRMHELNSTFNEQEFEPYNQLQRDATQDRNTESKNAMSINGNTVNQSMSPTKQLKFTLPQLHSQKGRFDIKRRAILENQRVQKQQNNSFSVCYPAEDKMKIKDKVVINSFMLGGYNMIDYSDAINKLHKKLLKKIILHHH